MCAAAATMGDVMVKNVIPKHLEATTAKLEEIGCEVEEFDDAVRVVASKRLKRTHVKTMPLSLIHIYQIMCKTSKKEGQNLLGYRQKLRASV